MTEHPIPPVWDGQARVLILGSFPSVRSRREGFFYGHPQNRFWRVLAAVWEEEPPVSVEEKKAFLLAHRIALWDVIASCEVQGSADSSIRDAVPCDITPILRGADIRCVFTNGTAASSMYKKHLAASAGDIPHVSLPSTSPANASWSAERLCGAWRVVRDAAEGAPLQRNSF